MIRKVLLAALVVGIVLRIAIALASSGVEPWSDMRVYLDLSRAIDSGSIGPAADRPLAYPLFLSLFSLLGLRSLAGVYLVQAALFGLTLLGTAWWARSLGGAGAAACAIVLAPMLTFAQYSGLLLTENLFLPLFAVWAALALSPEPRTWKGGIAGVLAGAAAAVRPAALPLAAGTVLALVLRGKRGVRPAFSFAVATAIVGWGAMSVTARLAGTRPTLAPTAGINLYIGNSETARADGGGQREIPERLSSIPDARERNARAAGDALTWIARHPVRALCLAGVRLCRLGGVNPGAVEHAALVGYGLPSPVAIGWLAVEWFAVLLFAAIGVAARPQLRAPLRDAAAVALPYVLVLCATFVQTRFRLPLVLLLVPFAAAGIRAVVFRDRRDPIGPVRAWPFLCAGAWLAAGMIVDAVSRIRLR